MVPPSSEYKKFRDYQGIQTKTMAFHSFVRKQYFNIFDPEGLKLLTHLRLGFSYLHKHYVRHNFQECIKPLCTCLLEAENTSHHLLYYHHNTPFHTDLTNNVNTFIFDFDSSSDS